ncbi:helix-turn-helix domain-containing protein [Aestuariivivens marinum]|uniref:helix-turn-helix domain-containing protein n=1 Tax=Aestuariivivens marinum TaxID=2913555 RepID=UPI001F5659C3|nr:helix-turn-helix domain-containing protein [Aestuariivivens marinum]
MKSLQLIEITPEQLQDAIVNGVNTKLDDLKKNFQPKEPEEYLTRHEVAEMFKIDISSVHNWTKRGKIVSYGVPGSGRVYYKRSELEKLLIQIK